MSEIIVQFNEEIIKGQLKELVRGITNQAKNYTLVSISLAVYNNQVARQR